MPLKSAEVEAIERATVAAVAPDACRELPGWLLPLDAGTIGRSHSAVPLRHDGNIQASDVQAIDQLYREAGLAPSFRVADVPGLAHLQPALAQAGLRPTQPTLTMVATADQLLAARPVAGGNLPKGPQAVVLQLPTEAWRTVYLGEGFDPVDGAHRVRALGRAVGSVYAQSSPNGDLASGVVATGVGSFGHGWLGVHGMRTLPPHRGRGHASSILRALALEAHRRGVARAYLQVEEANAGARRLYESLGFVAAWRYHYWRPGA